MLGNWFDGIGLASSTVKVCFGSGADERRHHQEGLLLEVKRTKFVNKRTLALDQAGTTISLLRLHWRCGSVTAIDQA